VEADAARQAMLAGMVFFAEQAGCSLIAEGIETDAERATLQRLGIRLGQGYLLGRPEARPRHR
jgi:EAL domain-containing protein (putative c-di-GMP-specific phosphodiesterase class I)